MTLELANELERVRKMYRELRGDCICSQQADGVWITPPSCPFHGIDHLRDANDHRIRRFPSDYIQQQTVFDALDKSQERVRELEEALKAAHYRLLLGKLAATRQTLEAALSSRQEKEGESRG